jgi:hypothetical protein
VEKVVAGQLLLASEIQPVAADRSELGQTAQCCRLLLPAQTLHFLSCLWRC